MEILRKEMKLKGFTSIALSKELYVDPATITAWLKGSYNPTPKNVKRMKDMGFSDVACLEPSKDIEI